MMASSTLSDEARVFKLHVDVFVLERDCDCILDDITDSKLIDTKKLDSIRSSSDKNRFVRIVQYL